jgi:hypothetical protein
MSEDSWSVVARFADSLSAEPLAGLLQSEGLACQIVRSETLPGLVTDVAVLVPTTLLHRAQWILSQARVSDEELGYLATGELPGDPPKS